MHVGFCRQEDERNEVPMDRVSHKERDSWIQ
jgi:hypothetical protein